MNRMGGKIVAILTALIMLAGMALPAAAEETADALPAGDPVNRYGETNLRVNLRTEPSPDSDKVDTLPKGEQVFVFMNETCPEDSRLWSLVLVNETEGYIRSKFITMGGEEVPGPELLSYAQGREAEAKGDLPAAEGFYAEAGSFRDAGERYAAVTAALYGDQYAEAKAMLERNDPAGAYSLLAELNGYADSPALMEEIVGLLGYNPVHDHEWQEATCTAPKTCGICGTTEGEPLGHDWKEATCTAPKTCGICGETEGVPLGHDRKEATCTEPKTCARCGETEGEPLGHDWKEATCTEPKTCARCGETEGEPLGHDWKEATCTEPKTCARCGETEGEPLGHEWQEAACTGARTCGRCGMTDGEPLGHDWQEATCTEAKTCTRCGETEGEPLGHDWQDATCTEPKTCTRCGETEGEPLGHDWQEATFVDPQVCGRCGETGEERQIPRNSKKPFLGVVTVAEGERKAVRRWWDVESDVLLWAYPGARYACYEKVGRWLGADWYKIWIPEEQDWGWISSRVSDLGD